MKQTTILFLLCAALLAGQARAQRPPNLPGGLASGGFGAGQSATKNQVSIRISGGYRYITANGIPDHQPGRFPNRNNPNSIRPQNHQYRLTPNPRTNATPPGWGSAVRHRVERCADGTERGGVLAAQLQFWLAEKPRTAASTSA